MDHLPKPETTDTITRKFFAIPAGTDADVRRVMGSIYHQDEQRHFVAKLARHAGYPRWDRAIIAGKRYTGNRSTTAKDLGVDTVTAEMIYIPFVKENGNFTNAVLIVKATGTDTAYRVLYRTQYKLFTFDSSNANVWNARDVFHLFSIFERTVFGHNKLVIKDEHLLSNADRMALQTKRLTFSDVKVIYTFDDSTTAGTHRGTSMVAPDPPPPTCDHYSVCYAPINTASLCDFCSISNCDYYMGQGTECTVFVLLDNGPAPTQGGGGGGTGGDGGSGDNLDEDCGEPGQPATGLCGDGDPGWEPIITTPWFNPYKADTVKIDTSVSFHFPCVQKIVDSISSYVNINAVAQIVLNTVFNVNKRIHITLAADPSLYGQTAVDAITYRDSAWTTGSVPDSVDFYATTYLNPWMLTHATQEYIAATIIHEAVHAYILFKVQEYKRGIIDSTTFKNLFPLYWTPKMTGAYSPDPSNIVQHNAMAANMVDIMAAPLNIINPNIPLSMRDSVFHALIWGGLEGTTVWYHRPDTFNIKAIMQVAKDTAMHAPFHLNANPAVEYNFDHSTLNLRSSCQ